MNTKKILKRASIAACCLLVACGSDANDDIDTTIYVTEQSFANGALSFSFGSNLVEFILISSGRVDNTSLPEDDDQIPVTCTGSFVIDGNTNTCTFEYNVNDSIGVLTVMYFNASDSNSSALNLYTESYSNYLGLDWSGTYDKPLYTIKSMSVTFDMIRGLCQTTTEYYEREYTSTSSSYTTTNITQSRQSGWNNYIVSRN